MIRLILPAFVAILLITSCTATTETSYSEVLVDSLVKAKLDSITWTLKRRNDSIINLAAQKEARRLDSLDQMKAPPVKITPVISEKLPPRDYSNESSKTPERIPKKDTAK